MDKEDSKVKKEKEEKKRKSAGSGNAEGGPSRRRVATTTAPHQDEIKALDTSSKKRKIHTVDLTTDRKPEFVSLPASDDEDQHQKPVISP